MELNVTKLIHEWLDEESGCGPIDYSASVAEIGAGAARSTWRNAQEDAGQYFDLTDDQVNEAKDWFGEFGAWEPEEIAEWTRDEVHALLLQYIAGDYREVMWGEDKPTNYEEYEEATRDVGGNLYPVGDDFTKCEWFFYVGN